ncbi:hypothetical protein MPER_01465, partial [Moniliophthora perniciosa FA553]
PVTHNQPVAGPSTHPVAPTPPPPPPPLPEVDMRPPTPPIPDPIPEDPEPGFTTGKRTRKAPSKFKHFAINTFSTTLRKAVQNITSRQPTPPPPRAPTPVPQVQTPEPRSPTPPPPIQRTYVRTEKNEHNLFRIYDTKLPSRCPDLDIKESDVADAPMIDTGEDHSNVEDRLATAMGVTQTKEEEKLYYHPFKNPSSFHIINWASDKTTISNDALNRFS